MSVMSSLQEIHRYHVPPPPGDGGEVGTDCRVNAGRSWQAGRQGEVADTDTARGKRARARGGHAEIQSRELFRIKRVFCVHVGLRGCSCTASTGALLAVFLSNVLNNLDL